MKIGFIGAGNMAQAIIQGMVASQSVSETDIFLTASSPERSQMTADKLGVRFANSNSDLVKEVDVLILAVKPHLLPTILTEIQKDLVKNDVLLISIAAGLTLANLAELTPEMTAPRIIRVMPNMNVAVRKGVSAVTANAFATEEDIKTTESIFNTVGSSYLIEEKDFRNFTSLAGCSPAYTYLYIDAMSRAGVKNGLPKDLATKIATEAVLGSAEMLKQASSETPWDLIDKVCSPGGTTVAGLVSLENDAFTATVIRALDATITRDQELESK